MRIWKRIIVISLLCAVGIFSLGCASKSDSAVSENQIVTVQRGDLTIDIAAVGNLVLSVKEDLAFEMSGTVEEVLVAEGDTVEEGQVLAKLDTSEWDKELTALESDLLQAEINLRNAETALEKAQDIYKWPELEVAEADVDEAKAHLQYALDRAAEAGGGWYRVVERYEAVLAAAEKRLKAMLTGADPEEVEIKKMQVEIVRGKLEDAQKALDEALNASPEITAPFDGFITKVNVDGGDEVKKGTVAVQLADPNKFEADIMVNEMDIFQVKLEGDATVQIDAMPMLTLPAKVTHISPTATIQQGVVNYKVKVEIESLESVMQEQREARQKAMQGELPERLRQAVEEGRITQEEAEEMIKQRQQEQGGQPGQMPTMMPEDFQLREGLTVTVSIIVEERNDVLLVPNGAIIRQGLETYVQVLRDGVVEQRSITTGISDWQYTEVTDGLSEGEKVVVPETTTTTPTTPEPGGMRIPGMGRM